MKNATIANNNITYFLAIIFYAYFDTGFSTLPTNIVLPVDISRIKKMKGRSTVTAIGSGGSAVNPTITAVAAAALFV